MDINFQDAMEAITGSKFEEVAPGISVLRLSSRESKSYNETIVLVAPQTPLGASNLYMINGAIAHVSHENVSVDGYPNNGLRVYDPYKRGLEGIAERFGFELIVENGPHPRVLPAPKAIGDYARLG